MNHVSLNGEIKLKKFCLSDRTDMLHIIDSFYASTYFYLLDSEQHLGYTFMYLKDFNSSTITAK